MSTATIKPEQAQQAFQFMAEQVYAPAFFDKLASYGVQPRTARESQQLLELGAILEQAEAEGHYKSAAVREAEAANPFLDHVLGRLKGALSSSAAPAVSEGHLKAGALKLVQSDPVSRQAALIYGHIMSGGAVEEPQAA
jgi:hypothetical protein